jgi:hypothetical protein
MALATDQTQFKINLRHLGKLYKNFLRCVLAKALPDGIPA